MPKMKLPVLRGGSMRCCCCTIRVAGVVVGVLQTIIIALVISKSVTIYEHRGSWMRIAQFHSDLGFSSVSDELLGKRNITGHGLAVLEMGLADNVAVNAVWLIFLAFYAAAFKTERALLVVPNLVMTGLSLIWGIFWIASLAIGIADNENLLQKLDTAENGDRGSVLARFLSEERTVWLIIILTFYVFVWILDLIFVIVIKRLYSVFSERDHHSRPRGSVIPSVHESKTVHPPLPIIESPTPTIEAEHGPQIHHHPHGIQVVPARRHRLDLPPHTLEVPSENGGGGGEAVHVSSRRPYDDLPHEQYSRPPPRGVSLEPIQQPTTLTYYDPENPNSTRPGFLPAIGH